MARGCPGRERLWREADHDWAAFAMLVVQAVGLDCATSAHSRTFAAAKRSTQDGSAARYAARRDACAEKGLD
jgi:hypothetical protein